MNITLYSTLFTYCEFYPGKRRKRMPIVTTQLQGRSTHYVSNNVLGLCSFKTELKRCSLQLRRSRRWYNLVFFARDIVMGEVLLRLIFAWCLVKKKRLEHIRRTGHSKGFYKGSNFSMLHYCANYVVKLVIGGTTWKCLNMYTNFKKSLKNFRVYWRRSVIVGWY